MTVWLRDLPDLFAAAGLRVVVLPGFDTRSRRSGAFPDPGPLGMSIHHTAGGTASGGIAGAMQGATTHEAAPIDNFRLDRDGTLYADAAGASNTVGKGGPLGPIPQDQGNARTVGLEICNNGVGEPYTPEIVEALPVYCEVLYRKGIGSWGWESSIPQHRLFAHFEWAPTRKIDPAGPSPWWQPADRYGRWDMDMFRDDIRTRIQPPITTPSEEDDMFRVIKNKDAASQITCSTNGLIKVWLDNGHASAAALRRAGQSVPDDLAQEDFASHGPIVGPVPAGHDPYGRQR